MKPVIHSEKHILQNSLATVLAGAVGVVTIAQAVDDVTTGNEQVAVGSSIKAIFLEDWVKTNDTSAGSFVYCLVKIISGGANPTAANMANLNDYPNKNNLFYVTQGLSNVGTADALAMHKGWVKIPKGKQRMSLGDTWVSVLFAQALDQNHCGCAIYKEYS